MKKVIRLAIAVVMSVAMVFTATACGCSKDNSGKEVKIHDPIEYAVDDNGNAVVALYKSTMDANEQGEVVIEDKFQDKPVIGITEGAFTGNSGIKKVTMPETIEYIDRMAFRGCRSLAEVNWPDSLKTIGDAAFMATAIKEATLKNAEVIGAMAFANNINLEKLTIKGSITRLENIVEGDTKLKELHLPATITEIAEDFTIAQNATIYTPDNSVVVDYCTANGINYKIV